MNFNWRTDDEPSWDSEVSPSAEASAGPSRRVAQIGLVFLLVALAGFFLWRGVDKRAARNREALAQDVRSSHALAMRAAAQRDGELLTPLLSGREPRWTETQLRLLEENLLFNEAATPFGFEPAGSDPTVTDMAWSPDLQEAIVTTRYGYTLDGAGIAGESAWLEQVHVYRRGAESWLLSPPDEAFWGPWQAHSGQHVTLHFHERDAPAAHAMTPVLDRALTALCSELSRACPQEESFDVRLEPDGDALRRLQDDRYPRFLFGELSLPSPTLVGVGVDEQSQGALSRGYARYLIIAATQRLLDFDCCYGAQFMDSLAAMMAYELGYGANPLENMNYLQMVDSIYTLGQFERLWWSNYESPFTDDERAQVATFERFLRMQSGASAAEMQQALAESLGFWGWVQPFIEFDVVADRSGLEAAWRDFVFLQANLSQEAPADPPIQTLKLICEDEAGQRALYDYDPAHERWTYDHNVRGRAPALVATPGDDGVVVFDRVTADPTRRPARLVRDGQEIPLTGDLTPAYSLPGDPVGRYMPMWRVSQSGRTIDGAVLLDVGQCQEERRCRQRTLGGLPSWSPDGEHIAVWSTDSGEITLLSRDFSSALSSNVVSSQLPFWLDEQTLAIVSEDGEWIQTSQLGRYGLASPELEGILSLEEVLVALGRDGSEPNWRLAQSHKVPGARAFVGALTLLESGARHFFVAYFDEVWRLSEIIPLSYMSQVVVSSPETLISADGNWLALQMPALDLEAPRFLLHDLHSGDIVLDSLSPLFTPLFTAVRAHDWSADGKWLAHIGLNHVELITARAKPEDPLIRQFVSSGNLQCTSLAWVYR